MDSWWCMDCRSVVELNKHGRCGCCESEAVDPIAQADRQLGAVSAAHTPVSDTSACA